MKILSLWAMQVTIALAVTAVASAESFQSTADQGEIAQTGFTCSDAGCGDCCGCDDGCGCGRDCCVAKVEMVKVEKHCWCIKTEKKCVPKVVCPWANGGSGLTLFNFLKKRKGAGCGDCCGCADACGGGCCDTCSSGCCEDGCCCRKPRCGKVICVRDLEKKKYECEKCVCKWEIRRLPPCCDGCGPECCDALDACGAAVPDTLRQPVPSPAPAPTPHEDASASSVGGATLVDQEKSRWGMGHLSLQ